MIRIGGTKKYEIKRELGQIKLAEVGQFWLALKASEGKRQAIIKKVADEIFDRVTRSGIQKEVEGEISSKLKEPGPEYTEEEKNEFVFNTIDDKDEKISGRLLISDGSVLIKQLEQVVKKAVKMWS